MVPQPSSPAPFRESQPPFLGTLILGTMTIELMIAQLLITQQTIAHPTIAETMIAASTITGPPSPRLRFWQPSTLHLSVPLPLSGHQMLCLSLDRHHIREYVKHPKQFFRSEERRVGKECRSQLS